MGKAIDRVGRPALGTALLRMSDSRALVRAAVIEMLDAWEAAAGTRALLRRIAWAAATPKCSSVGKKELLNWVTGLIQRGRDVHKSLDQIVKLVVVASSDKLAGIRDAGKVLLEHLVERFGSRIDDAARALDGGFRKAAIEAVKKIDRGVLTSNVKEQPLTEIPPSRRYSGTGAVSGANSKGVPLTNRIQTPKTARFSDMRGKTVTKGQEGKLTAAEPSLFVVNDQKDARAKTRSRFTPELETMLRRGLEPLVSPAIGRLLFSKEFKHKCQAADWIKASVDTQYDGVISCVDLIFRWAAMRIVEGNTQILVKTLDMLRTLLGTMVKRGYRMSQYEGRILIPVLVENSGHNQDRIRKAHRELLVFVTKVLPLSQVLSYLVKGLESKNNKTKVECAQTIGDIIDSEGMAVIERNTIAHPLDDCRRPLRRTEKIDKFFMKEQAAFKTVEAIYDFEGDRIWELLGTLTDQQRNLIEKRIKGRKTELAKEGLTPGSRSKTLQEVKARATGAKTENDSPRADEPLKKSTLPTTLMPANSNAMPQDSGTIQDPQSSVYHKESRRVSDRSGGAASASAKYHNKATKAGLAAIFNKIGDKVLNKEGLRDLCRFKRAHQNVGALCERLRVAFPHNCFLINECGGP
ncbi:hypothetical protein BSKO_02683 [Bryopsis sp. KO-2023]|nr:hypothetical protein BSKO_02683 [Bryopsis sp. KO-2023]